MNLTKTIAGLLFFTLGAPAAMSATTWNLGNGFYSKCSNSNGTLSSDICPNGMSAVSVSIASISGGSQISINMAPSSNESAFLYKLTIPVGLQVSDINVTNGGAPKSKSEESGLQQLVTDGIIDGLYDALSMSGVVFALKVFTADLPTAGDPSILSQFESQAPILSKRYYPYTTYDGSFVRTDKSTMVTLNVQFKRPVNDVLRYLRVLPASIYVGTTPPGNEVLIEGLRYTPKP